MRRLIGSNELARLAGAVGAAVGMVVFAGSALGQTEKVHESWMPEPAVKFNPDQKPWGFGPRVPGFSNPWRIRSMGELNDPSPSPSPMPMPDPQPEPRRPGERGIQGLDPVLVPGWTTEGYVAGSGLSVNALYQDEHLRLALSLGSTGIFTRRYVCDRPVYRSACHGLGGSDFFGGYALDGFWVMTGTESMDRAVTPQRPQAAAPVPASAPAPASILEQAREASRRDDLSEAVRLYRAHLDVFTSDSGAMREVGLVLLRSREFAHGIAMVHLAYAKDPSLAARAFDATSLGERASYDLRRLLNVCVSHAHREGSSQAWLVVVALMQAEGRLEPARKMLDRAIEIGLERDIADAFKAALAG